MTKESIESEANLIIVGDVLTSGNVQTKIIKTHKKASSNKASSNCCFIKRANCSLYRITALGIALLIVICACFVIETIHDTKYIDEAANYGNNDEITLDPKHDQTYHKELVDFINKKANSTWKARYNRFATQSKYIFEHVITRSDSNHRPKNFDISKGSKEELLGDTLEHVKNLIDSTGGLVLPKHFDSRERWPLCRTIHLPLQQGSCGSCSIVSTAAVLSDRICINTNGTFQPQISIEDLLSCSSASCSGSNFAYTPIHYWITDGIVTGGPYGSYEGCKPYTISANCGAPCVLNFDSLNRELKCVKKCVSTYSKSYQEDLIKGKSGYWLKAGKYHTRFSKDFAVLSYMVEQSIGYEELIKRELYLNGPLLACLSIHDEFQHYDRGIYQENTYQNSTTLYGHCMKLIGYGVENEEKYFVYANTWGSNWGSDNGYVKISTKFLPEEVIGAIYVKE
uniref:Pept_C1 domain-containing protein n=1 Tax=Rhabditophanes sp. KR3021 TaxID=114890 RepID=A0AC35TFX4_9BILA